MALSSSDKGANVLTISDFGTPHPDPQLLECSFSGSITFDLGKASRMYVCYRLFVIMWFLFEGVSSSSWCLGYRLRYFIAALHGPSIYNYFEPV